MGEYTANEAPAAAAAAPAHPGRSSKKCLLLQTLLRINVALLSIVVIAVMVNAKETRHIAVLTLKARWNDSKAFVALVSVSAICLAFSVLQTILSLVTGNSQSSGLAWLNFIVDQLLTYTLLGAAAASAQIAYLAKHGSSTAGWAEVCSTFDTFCTRAGAAIILGFIAVVPLGLSSAISAYHLFRHKV